MLIHDNELLVCPNCGNDSLTSLETAQVGYEGVRFFVMDAEGGISADFDSCMGSTTYDESAEPTDKVDCPACDSVDLDIHQLVTRELWEAATEGLVTA